LFVLSLLGTWEQVSHPYPPHLYLFGGSTKCGRSGMMLAVFWSDILFRWHKYSFNNIHSKLVLPWTFSVDANYKVQILISLKVDFYWFQIHSFILYIVYITKLLHTCMLEVSKNLQKNVLICGKTNYSFIQKYDWMLTAA